MWRRLAPLLEAAGHRVAVPDLRGVAWWEGSARLAVSALPAADVVLAHSGAGVLAAPVLAALPSPRAVVLIDAILPPASGRTVPSADVRATVRDLAVDGVLPPWTSWWGDEALAEVLPDEEERAALAASAPRLPVSCYDVEVPAPDGWEPPVRGYLRLSPAYDGHAAEAAARGWRVSRLDGGHLDLLGRPEPVSEAVLELL